MLLHPRHTTGWTIAATAFLTVALSLAPLPSEFRPLPELRSRPRDVLASIVGERLLPPAPVAAAAPVEPPPLLLEQPTEAADAGVGHPPALSVDPQRLLLASIGADQLPDAVALDALARKVGAVPPTIEEGCRRPAADGACEERALDGFLEALRKTDEGTREQPVRVVHLGDSLIASDHITDVIRERLQARHGFGGRGLLLVDRPTRGAGRAVRTGTASAGWVVRKITDGDRGAGKALGLTGVTYVASGKSERSEFDPAGARSAELFFTTDPRGGTITLHADGKRIGTVFTRLGNGEPAFARIAVPVGAKSVSVTASGIVQLDGIAFEQGGPGIVYDTFGLPGSTAGVLLQLDDSTFRKQLSHRQPSLVVLMLGGNEAFELSRGRGSIEQVRTNFQQLVGRIQGAVPEAGCLLVGPMDAGVRNMRGELSPRSTTREVSAVVRETALQTGCAFWDMQAAMGGEGSALKWLDAGLMNEDLVHPLSRGGDLLGHLFDLSVARVVIERDPASALEDPPGLTQRGDELERTFAKLRRLEKQKEGRVAILQFGASHTAAHFFTDRLRTRLQERFGDAGRGYVAFGKSSPRLKSAGVDRALTGTWVVQDALKAAPELPWGLTGIRAEGTAGSTATIKFCTTCGIDSVKSRLALHYLAEPQMGRLAVLLDGRKIADLPEEPAEVPEARVFTFEAEGPKHALTVKNAGGGPVSLFGAVSEFERPGVLYDALGLPGATIFHLAQMNAEVLKKQLTARRPDLFVFFYGTNESAIVDLDPDLMKWTYGRVFQTLKEVAPEAECLIIGPTDRLQAKDGGWYPAASQDRVIRGVREVAAENGCAFWSARASMGGVGSIARWLNRRPALAHPDRVHLTQKGYTTLADGFLDELLHAYDAEKSGERR